MTGLAKAFGAGATIVIFVLAISSLPADAVNGYRECTHALRVQINEDNVDHAYDLGARHTSCRFARRLARKVITNASEDDGPFLGYRCAADDVRVVCRRGTRGVRWFKSENRE